MQSENIADAALSGLHDPNKAIGVSGAGGLMGIGIVTGLIAHHPQRPIIAHDCSKEACSRLPATVRSRLRDLQAVGIMTHDIPDPLPLTVVSTYAHIAQYREHIGAWIEAITEDQKLKESFFHSIVDVIPASAPLCTNTSSLDIHRLSQVVGEKDPKNAERFFGSHWSNPADVFPLVECANAEHTSPDLLNAWSDFLRSHQWTPLCMNQFANGYVLNALQFSALDEACTLLDENPDRTPAMVDSAVKICMESMQNIDSSASQNTDEREMIRRMRHRLTQTTDKLLDKDIATQSVIDTILRYGLGIRWQTVGLLKGADFGKIDLFLTIHRILMQQYSNSVPSNRLVTMVNQGKIGVQPAKHCWKGFYTHDETSIQQAQQSLLHAFADAREALSKQSPTTVTSIALSRMTV